MASKKSGTKETVAEKVKYTPVPKIGTRHMGNARKVLAGEVGDVLPLGIIMGIASDTKRGTSQFGEFIGLRGKFRFIPADGSQPLQTGTVYLPGDMTAQIAAQLGNGGTVQFAFKVSAVNADPKDSPIGYYYQLDPVLEASGDDPLDAIMSAIDPKALALPAPAKG